LEAAVSDVVVVRPHESHNGQSLEYRSTGPVPVVRTFGNYRPLVHPPVARQNAAMSDPIYTPENCKTAYQLNWAVSLFWHDPPDN
jgi:hypothetical protein